MIVLNLNLGPITLCHTALKRRLRNASGLLQAVSLRVWPVPGYHLALPWVSSTWWMVRMVGRTYHLTLRVEKILFESRMLWNSPAVSLDVRGSCHSGWFCIWSLIFGACQRLPRIVCCGPCNSGDIKTLNSGHQRVMMGNPLQALHIIKSLGQLKARFCCNDRPLALKHDFDLEPQAHPLTHTHTHTREATMCAAKPSCSCLGSVQRAWWELERLSRGSMLANGVPCIYAWFFFVILLNLNPIWTFEILFL